MFKTINDFYKKLLEVNSSNDFEVNKGDDAADLMLDLQDYLINNKIISDNLFPLNIENDEQHLIANIFLEVRRDFQADNEEIHDFSYLSVADKWLNSNAIKISF